MQSRNCGFVVCGAFFDGRIYDGFLVQRRESVMKHRAGSAVRFLSGGLFALSVLGATGTVGAAETEYSGTWCASAKRTVLESNPDVTVTMIDSLGIQTPNSTFKPWENATVHCMGYYRSMQGKLTQKGACRWTDATGDTFTGEYEGTPDKPPVWTFLAGTGKWKGIKGSGTYRYVTAAKPADSGTLQLCIEHSGKYELP